MSIDLIYESLYAALSLADASLQIWIYITFALIVAGHAAGSRIARSTCWLISCLYGFYSGVLVLRYFSAAYQIIYYQDLLVSHNMEPWPVPKMIGILIGTGTSTLMVGGTVATLWFIRSVRRSSAFESQ